MPARRIVPRAVPRAALLLLHDRHNPRRDLRQMLDHVFPTVADDDHHVLGFEVSRGFDDVSNKGPSGDRMEDFRHGGLHPLALAGGQDDDDPGARTHGPILVHQ